MDDFNRALDIDPDNKDLLRQRNVVKDRLKAIQQREERIFSNVLT